LFNSFAPTADAQQSPGEREIRGDRSIAGRSADWPTWKEIERVATLRDYNVRIVVLGATLLGCAAGMVGSFTLLRKRALMGDALSHATLPGIVIAFILATQLGGSGKSMPILMAGATISGLLGVCTILAMVHLTRLKEDTALGSVLSVFFGAGVALMSVSQQMQRGHSAGLESFIYGKTASMGMADTQMIAAAAAVCIVASTVLFKELKLLCFDDDFARARGFPITSLDVTLMGLVVLVTIVGLQAVGLILMIALLIIPAASARFWTERLGRMFLISGGIGTLSGWLGASVSALFSKLPSGAMIVLVCASLFCVSMVFGSARGLLVRARNRLRLNRAVDRQHLLRALYELLETSTPSPVSRGSRHRRQTVGIDALLRKRSWSKNRLLREVRRSQRGELVEWVGDRLKLTRRGRVEAARLTRQHRLWELYLINYAEVAPAQVDRDADAIEHVLAPEIVSELESLLEREQASVPASPHEMRVSAVDESPAESGAH
jgi:manganese/zinc/iron transport system permease protein